MIVYSSPTCPQCKVLKMKMKEKELAYEEISDVDEILKRGIKSVPTLELDDGTIIQSVEAIKWVKKYDIGGK